MKTLLIVAATCAAAAPALAQSNAMAPMPPSSAAQTPTVVTPTDTRSIVAAEFPTYDKDGNGALDASEFGTWMMALKEKSGAATMSAADKAAWLKQAFATADADKNKGVTEPELIAYLTAGA